jgi:hypothetical protein
MGTTGGTTAGTRYRGEVATTAPQEALISRAREGFIADERVVAAYLVGGLAVGQGDPWSDVHLQCPVRDDTEQAVASSWHEIANAIAPTAYIQPFAGTTGGLCVTPQWLHFGLVSHAASSVDSKTVEGMVPLVDKGGLLPERGAPRPYRKGEPFFACLRSRCSCTC